ncbi:MAG: hypothetical protein RL264_2719 [Bacteroidota bacterium]
MKKALISGMSVGVVSSGIGYAYWHSYNHFLFDFSKAIPAFKLISAYFSLSFIFAGISTFASGQFMRWVNLLIGLIGFTSILLPMLQREVPGDFPELFPGFAIPLYVLWPLCWLSISPFFTVKK